jgi:hypothetical protein
VASGQVPDHESRLDVHRMMLEDATIPSVARTVSTIERSLD